MAPPPPPVQRFDFGKFVMTRGIADQIARSEAFATSVLGCMRPHRAGDWTEVGADDALTNDWRLANLERLLSTCTVEGERVWVII